MRYIDKFSTSGDVTTALANGTLLKPYVAYVEASGSLDWNTKEPPHDYSKDYLTFEILSDGDIRWKTSTSTSVNKRTIQYRKNNGNWISIKSDRYSPPSISVSVGDILEFKGTNTEYCIGTEYSGFDGSSAQFNAYGNIMSLVYGDDFVGKDFSDLVGKEKTFAKLFYYAKGLKSAENLILPDNVIQNCYAGMFQGCSSLTTAPILKATTLATGCYTTMFYACYSLNYVKCLAEENIDDNIYNWLYTDSVGTFVKKAGVTWPTGYSGIPNNWTVVEV